MPTIMLNNNFSRGELLSLIRKFESVAVREKDHSLARNLRRDFIDGNPSSPNRNMRETIKQLATWCKTGGIYSEGMQVARQISRLLFGEVLDREALGV